MSIDMGNAYTCIDGFSGAGGLLLGLQRAGFESLCSFDNDPLSIETQRQNKKYFDHATLIADINELSPEVLLKEAGIKKEELFLLAGGPPCQGFSIQRIGDDTDDRNDLVASYVRLLERIRPKFFLMENVPGIMGKRGKSYFEKALERMESIGYQSYHQILNAQDFGVPQRRRRVIVIGIRNDLHQKPFAFPKAKTPEGKRMTVRDAIGHLPQPPIGGTDHPEISHHRSDKLSAINLKRISFLKPGQGREHLPKSLVADCHKVSASKIGHRNVYGRMSWDEVAPTITARFDSFTRGMFGHPEQNRSISLREGALIQTFPGDFNFVGSKVDIARQIGNAVPPNLAEAIGRSIISYYESLSL